MRLSSGRHGLLLCAFALFMCALWMLPVLMAGYSWWLPNILKTGEYFANTGTFFNDAGHPEVNIRFLTVFVLQPLHHFIAWDDVMSWTVVSAVSMALALFPLFWIAKRLFDRRVAWVTVVLFSFFPMTWIEALRVEGFTFAFFFLFLGIAFYLYFAQSRRWLAVILFGLCFGCTLASRDAFLALLPGFVTGYIWSERKHWKRATLQAFIGCTVAYIALALPLQFQKDMTLQARWDAFIPSLVNATPGEGHLYPDEYSFQFDKAAYDKIIQERAKDEGFIERQENANYRDIFGVAPVGITEKAFNSVWLFINNLPPFIFPQTIGGAFMLLFLIPGLLFLYREHRKLFWNIAWLWLSMELFLRVVLHFARTHIADISGVIALVAALGVVTIASALHEQRKRTSLTAITTFIVLIAALQLLQVNRKEFAAVYAKSDAPMAYAAADVLNKLPDNAVIAHPKEESLFFFAKQRGVGIHPETIDRLSKEKRLAEPFKKFGVQYVIGYDAQQTALIKAAVPSIKVITVPDSENFEVKVTPGLQWFLNVFR